MFVIWFVGVVLDRNDIWSVSVRLRTYMYDICDYIYESVPMRASAMFVICEYG